MLIYEKTVNGVRHLFGATGNVPTESDVQLTYKDYDGDTITPSINDTYYDDGEHGAIRESDGAFVTAWMGETNVVPGGFVTPVVTVTEIKAETNKRFKSAYTVGEKLTLTGLTVTATYSDETTAKVNDYTTTPTVGTELSASNTTITITYKGQTTTVPITVTEAEE